MSGKISTAVAVARASLEVAKCVTGNTDAKDYERLKSLELRNSCYEEKKEQETSETKK